MSILFAGAIDVECKATSPKSAVLEIAITLFSVFDLKMVDSLDILINPEDPFQVERDVAEQTLAWWRGEGNPDYAPSQAAIDHVWYTKTCRSLPEAMSMLEGFLGKYRENLNNIRFGMRGPDFDYPIIKDALEHVGIERSNLRFSKLDSNRTVDAFNELLGIPEVNPVILDTLSPFGRHVPHTAICDAIEEGYQLARFYNLAGRLRVHPELSKLVDEYRYE